MALPATLATILETTWGRIVETVPVSGGDISSAARVRLADDRQVLVKWRAGSLPGLFTAERRGLELLHSAEALRIPQLLCIPIHKLNRRIVCS